MVMGNQLLGCAPERIPASLISASGECKRARSWFLGRPHSHGRLAKVSVKNDE
jgi:hypothetical protein